ncbi:cytochrome c3 family protein, partial [Gemmatimonadota bacterium]
MLFKHIRSRIAGVGTAASMVVGGMILYRLDVCVVAFARPEGVAYFPSWEEFAVSFGIVAGGILIFLFFVENLSVFDDVSGHPAPEPPRYEPSTVRPLLPKTLALPRGYSLAFLTGAALALPFLPVGGVDQTPVPVQRPRSVDAVIREGGEGEIRELSLVAASVVNSARSGPSETSTAADLPGPETTRVLMIDGNRDGDLVLFDHDDHAERLGGQASCETCHHLTKPLDENTSCSECHRDMYESRSVFNHDIHVAQLGGNEGCVECHSDGTQVKSYESITECSECHREEVASRAFVEAPPAHWEEAVGYMEAMHALCVECHKREALTAPGEHPEDLNQCMTCHDVDWREDVRRMMPARRIRQEVAGGEPAAPMRRKEIGP